jgi:hypothetical protein
MFEVKVLPGTRGIMRAERLAICLRSRFYLEPEVEWEPRG